MADAPHDEADHGADRPTGHRDGRSGGGHHADGHDRDEQVVVEHLPASALAPQQARALVDAHVTGAEELRESARLLVSELVTNAVLHARSDVTVRVVRSPDVLRVEVADDGTSSPHVVSEPGATGGFGLRIVARLASAWGWRPVEAAELTPSEATRRRAAHVRTNGHPSPDGVGGGKVVWFELRVARPTLR